MPNIKITNIHAERKIKAWIPQIGEPFIYKSSNDFILGPFVRIVGGHVYKFGSNYLLGWPETQNDTIAYGFSGGELIPVDLEVIF